MKQALFPIWFRSYFFIPILAVLYVVIPLFIWNFSPHALTHTVPDFLLGATDWGSGNIYTFTKLAYWLGLICGTVANANVWPQEDGLAKSFWWKIRLNQWHIGAAFCIPLIALPARFEADTEDMWILFGYFLLCTVFIIFLLAAGRQKKWPKALTHLLALVVSMLWVLAPIAIGRP